MALLRAYARPYAQATAGTPQELAFDAHAGQLRYRYSTTLPDGRAAGDRLTEIRIPAINFPQGYDLRVEGAERLADNSPTVDRGETVLRFRNLPDVATVDVTITRVGELPPLPANEQAQQTRGPNFSALPPIK